MSYTPSHQVSFTSPLSRNRYNGVNVYYEQEPAAFDEIVTPKSYYAVILSAKGVNCNYTGKAKNYELCARIVLQDSRKPKPEDIIKVCWLSLESALELYSCLLTLSLVKLNSKTVRGIVKALEYARDNNIKKVVLYLQKLVYSD